MTDLYMNYLVRSQTINQSLLGAYLQARAVFSADNLGKTKFICHLGPFVLYWFGYWPLFDHHSDSLHFLFIQSLLYTVIVQIYPFKTNTFKAVIFLLFNFQIVHFYSNYWFRFFQPGYALNSCVSPGFIHTDASWAYFTSRYKHTDSFVLPAIFFLHSFIFKTEFNSLGLGARYDICLD